MRNLGGHFHTGFPRSQSWPHSVTHLYITKSYTFITSAAEDMFSPISVGLFVRRTMQTLQDIFQLLSLCENGEWTEGEPIKIWCRSWNLNLSGCCLLLTVTWLNLTCVNCHALEIYHIKLICQSNPWENGRCWKLMFDLSCHSSANWSHWLVSCLCGLHPFVLQASENQAKCDTGPVTIKRPTNVRVLPKHS